VTSRLIHHLRSRLGKRRATAEVRQRDRPPDHRLRPADRRRWRRGKSVTVV